MVRDNTGHRVPDQRLVVVLRKTARELLPGLFILLFRGKKKSKKERTLIEGETGERGGALGCCLPRPVLRR